MEKEILNKIDKLIKNIDKYKIEPAFSNEKESRNNRRVSEKLTDKEIIEIFTTLIAFSQNANSEHVRRIINTGIFREIFANFNIDKIVKMNPCDLADQYWNKIGGIRQQAKLFHIVSLARKIKNIGSFNELLTETEIPTEIRTENDIDSFWIGFKKLKKVMKENSVPFFRSTTSLLHFLLATGYDCVKPDSAVMKVAKKIGIVESEKEDKNLIQTVRTIQEYSIVRNIRPAIIDFYFLIEGEQSDAKKYVKDEFYNKNEKSPASLG